MTAEDEADEAVLAAFANTTLNRGAFERLDLQAAESVLSMLDQAVVLAREHPFEFFAGFPQASEDKGEAEIGDRGPGGAQQSGSRTRPPSQQLDPLLDFFKSQKEYWSGRDESEQEEDEGDCRLRSATWTERYRRTDGVSAWSLRIEVEHPSGSIPRVDLFAVVAGREIFASGTRLTGLGGGRYRFQLSEPAVLAQPADEFVIKCDGRTIGLIHAGINFRAR